MSHSYNLKIKAALCSCWLCWSHDVNLKEQGDGGMPGSIVCHVWVECNRCGARGLSFTEEWRNDSPHKRRAILAWYGLKAATLLIAAAVPALLYAGFR